MKSLNQIKNELYTIRLLGAAAPERDKYICAISRITYEVDKVIAINFFLKNMSVRKIAKNVHYSPTAIWYRLRSVYKQVQLLLEDG